MMPEPMAPPEVHKRLEVIGYQANLNGENIPITQFANLEEKRELKKATLDRFGGEIFRSVIRARDFDNNERLGKLGRLDRTANGSDVESTLLRADSFGKKTMETISTFPSVLTFAYTNLLSKEGDMVFDPFCGHNSRAEDVLFLNRKYYAYDVHKYPLKFTSERLGNYPRENYDLNYASSEKVKYPDNTFDFSITCPPYFDVEDYNRLYEEEKHDDLSSKDYDSFLLIYDKCMSEVYRVLKPGAFFVIVVGDVHKNHKYTSLMLETIRLCQKAGFSIHDINIYNRSSNIGGDLNPRLFLEKLKRFPTIHEFILVFKKPGGANGV